MQHLNLVSQITLKTKPVLAAAEQLRWYAVALGLMCLVFLFLWFDQRGRLNELNVLQQEQESIAAELANAQSQRAQLSNRPELDEAIDVLQGEVDFRRRLLSSVEPEPSESQRGFAEHLSGLARQHVDGLQFSEIVLHEGGKQLSLAGHAKRPEYVPQFLQKLAAEPVFAGQHFSVLRMELPKDKPHLHRFELRAKEAKQQAAKTSSYRLLP